MSPVKTRLQPEVTLNVTEDHFLRAVPGDQCHCTIGQAVHDQLPDIIDGLNLKSVDANTISVNPAEDGDDLGVGVSMTGTDQNDNEVYVRFLLMSPRAFKVAFATDNRETGAMRRTVRKNPYALEATRFNTRLKQIPSQGRPDHAELKVTDPAAHLKVTASSSAQHAASADEAADIVTRRLTNAKAELPYRLTPKRLATAQDMARQSYDRRGTAPRRNAPVKVHRGQRFFA